MNRQRGVALSGLMFWGVIIALVAILGMKVGPEYLNYFGVLKAVKSVAASSQGKTVAEIRAAYGKQVEAGYFKTVGPADLDISKDGNDIVISFTYEARVPLFANISLLIDFTGTSSGRS